MSARIVIVVDMQNGVFNTPRFDRAGRVACINQLIDAAEHTIFIQHLDTDMQPGTEAWQILPELHQPPGSLYINKQACDSFWNTELDQLLQRLDASSFVICGCATDYCVDTTIKVGSSKGYAIRVAADAHTTSSRRWATAEQLIEQHNEVWANLILPGNGVQVISTAEIVQAWRTAA
ncbi:isochorismatase [Pantoea alhagi]|uniref:Isochorismatase n=1 Tax=Pantoea alhagi TaxID=1891675 RepID=A0A1W6B8F7_9GAMM|nr:isochorismatase family protein [Pantoea alhagi]ARJ43362.1 isochorismatase [Pantoea alhagi]URQ59452.1 isochorismatase family protein [Pantoea alhagi]